MSIQVLLALIGPEEVRKYSEDELEVLSGALVRAIEADQPTHARLLGAVRTELRKLEYTSTTQGV